MRRITSILAVAMASLIAMVMFAAGAGADGTYHTAQIPLVAQSGAPGGGTVVNIHTEGPTVYAHEIYRLQHAAPGTYTVTLHIHPATLDCSGDEVAMQTAMLDANAVGNGEADVKFTPEDADGLRGLTLSAFWTVEGPASYLTACNVLTLD
ncbi:MAG: hypothetical protein ACXVEY_01070 [Actinomycetota bacterium]